jgi:hypothetical protein
MDQLSERTVNFIRTFITFRILLIVVLIFAVYWYLNPRIVDFFANPTRATGAKKTTEER